MSAYLLSIVGVVLLSAVLSAVLPGGKTSKFIKGMTKLACLAVILAPVLDFFRGGDGETNFPFFSSETVIQTDVDFIDYCSTKRIENAEEELGNALEENFSVRPEVTLLWEYAGSITEGDGEEGYLSLYVGREIKITKVLLRDVGGSIGEEVKREMTEHIAEEYGCDAEFV